MAFIVFSAMPSREVLGIGVFMTANLIGCKYVAAGDRFCLRLKFDFPLLQRARHNHVLKQRILFFWSRLSILIFLLIFRG